MPIYVYRHDEMDTCEYRIEVSRAVDERDDLVICPKCEYPMLRDLYPGGTSFIMAPWFILLLALIGVGCDPVVRQEVLSSQPTTWSASCSHVGFCCAFGLDFEGDYDYSCGMKFNCPGSQTVSGQIETIKSYYESGKTEVYERPRVESRGACQ